jgi:hypothetical protein
METQKMWPMWGLTNVYKYQLSLILKMFFVLQVHYHFTYIMETFDWVWNEYNEYRMPKNIFQHYN